MSAQPSTVVTVAVVTYCSATVIGPCLRSIAGAFTNGERVQVVVVDNASTDDTVSIVHQERPDALVIETGANLGYAPAINRAAAAIPSDAVLVLNPDVELEPGSASALLRTFESSTVGIAVPLMRERDGRVAATLRRTPTVARAFGEAMLGGSRAGRYPALGETVPATSEKYAEAVDADWATGACWMVRRACLDDVGPWDERFWLFSEETDYALRAADAGWRLVHEPNAVILHLGGESNTNPRLWAALAANRVRSYAKRHGAASTWLFWCGVVLNEALRAPRHDTNRAALRALLPGPAAIAATYETAAGPRAVRRSNTDT